MTDHDSKLVVTEFLVRLLRQEKPRLSHVLLTHAGLRTTVLDTVERNDQVAASELALRLCDGARAHAESLGRRARFVVVAMADKRVLGQQAFCVEPDGSELELELGREGERFDKRAARHLEQLTKTYVDANRHLVHELAGLAKELAASNRELQRELDRAATAKLELVDSIEKNKSKAHKRELRRANHEQEREYKQVAFRKFVGLADGVLARMSGAPPVLRLWQSLRGEQREKMLAMLEPDQVEHLHELVELAEQAEESEQAARRHEVQ